ncbi:NAD-dependent epimerase/dehydratase family protein [Carboxydothermus pertinax]|uniref:Epimerase n=1 Tax=Carboxydothermus pertinax TaxID=870242 RepID=A0A1L8CUM9_9THEO|nr:NAD(P)-dependent oxidoreductase [Carboxydothermus pertinax]GAV22607.1 epimerase [Carboxydothermus pertinax]
MKIFITGGTGFIGRNLVEKLSKTYFVYAPSRKELDLTDEEKTRKFIKENKFDVIVHCATKPGHRNAKDPTNIFYTNVLMFLNILKNHEYFGKLIFLSSGAIYDQRFYKPKMTEEYFGEHIPVDETGLSKYVCAKLLENLPNSVELRPFGVFGKYEDYAIRFISNAICKAIFDLPITIKKNRKFDYIFIDDLVNIIEYFILNNSKYKAYNVTPDNSVELLEIARKILQISKKSLPIIIKENGMGIEYSGNNERLKKEIPDLKFTEIDMALEKLYYWYLENKDKIDYNLLLVDK